MRKNVVAPSVGESITEVSILKWAKQNGEAVKTGDLLLEIESDKATVEIVAEHTGTLQILKPAGEMIPIGEVVGFIDDAVAATVGGSVQTPAASSMPGGQVSAAPASSAPSAPPSPPGMPGLPPAPPGMKPPLPPTPPSAPANAASYGAIPPVPGAPAAPPPPAASAQPTPPMSAPGMNAAPGLSPAVRRAAASNHVDPATLSGTGKEGRVTKGDVLGAISSAPSVQTPAASSVPGNGAQTPAASSVTGASVPAVKSPAVTDKPGDRRVQMSMLRSKIAERLVYAQHTAAILTTFNEVDMSAVMKLRSEQKEAFKAKHGVNLSFMSFFTKASIYALKLVPEVNAMIDGRDTVYHDYYDVGVAVGTDRGLVVPVIRGADALSFVELERKIGELAIKGRDGKLSMADLTGGTFTISNGGTYGSLMSTPILNPPQSGILGMHKIMDRPMAINGKVEIRPMMYTALSYDHRIVDGKGAVTWLVHLKDALENPEKLDFTF
ncbi:MAG: 2-oxoglutarate dehydrogenase complex dihydrolipoyllysine-residue succinyltransferase [Cryobacterium sp.]|nr:2-oxoglutarate dehydrogenase complex dihydrolipoyllysine-residue succinyltransferase [Oligoflexia bacterium]